MPFEYQVDAVRRLVIAQACGTVSRADFVAYQREVWLCPDVAGFDELLDMSQVEQIIPPSSADVAELARMSASMDVKGPASKFAIVAPTDLAFGLGRMYATYRSMEKGSTKEVGVFRTLTGALAFLGIPDDAQLEGLA